jgi:hypothetical protein
VGSTAGDHGEDQEGQAIGISNFSRDEIGNLINAGMVSFFLVPSTLAYDGG